MNIINLKQYYPFCKEDIFVEVSDEIVEAFLLDKRAEAARDRKMFRYKAFYSLDCNDGIENAAIGWAQPSPEDYLIEKEELAEYEELILYDAAGRYLKELKDSGEIIAPKAWQREIDQLAAGKQADTLAMKSMREELKAVERLRKTAEQMSRQERDKSHDRGPER